MSLWQSYRNITPKTRIFIGAGIMAYAAAGLFLSDKAEESFGFTPTEEDKKRLKEAVPKVYRVDSGEVRQYENDLGQGKGT